MQVFRVVYHCFVRDFAIQNGYKLFAWEYTVTGKINDIHRNLLSPKQVYRLTYTISLQKTLYTFVPPLHVYGDNSHNNEIKGQILYRFSQFSCVSVSIVISKIIFLQVTSALITIYHPQTDPTEKQDYI